MLRRLPYAVFAVAALASCNAVTGINDITLTPDGGTTGTTTVPPIQYLAADGVTIREIAIYQGVKRSLVGGEPSPGGITAPIVEGREALVRVFVDVDDAYDGTEVFAHLAIGEGMPLEVVGTLTTSFEEELATTINFEVPGDLLVTGTQYRVELVQPEDHTKGGNAGARHPLEGSEPLDVASSGPGFKLMMLPVAYGADGSDRLPDMSDEQMEGFRNAFYQTYPTRQVELVMHAPMPWSQPISPNGAGWSQVLEAVADFRVQEGTPKDTYVFGFFNPATSFSQYCKGGCVSGLGLLGSANDDYSKAAVGLGFPGYSTFSTAIHEMGHTQGRQHANCGGAQNVDPKFPYPQAGIGVWGYDLVNKGLIDPAKNKDMMGYCDPYWISDYTFKAIFDRMKVVYQADVYTPPELRDRVWERARVAMDGSLVWLSPIKLTTPPQGEPVAITVLGKGGATVKDGQLLPYDHLPGGVLFWPKGKAPSAGIQVTVGGVTKSLTR